MFGTGLRCRISECRCRRYRSWCRCPNVKSLKIRQSVNWGCRKKDCKQSLNSRNGKWTTVDQNCVLKESANTLTTCPDQATDWTQAVECRASQFSGQLYSIILPHWWLGRDHNSLNFIHYTAFQTPKHSGVIHYWVLTESSSLKCHEIYCFRFLWIFCEISNFFFNDVKGTIRRSGEDDLWRKHKVKSLATLSL